MHPLFDRADRHSREIISAAIEVHRDKGPGLVESIYEWCLLCEFQLRGICVESQQPVQARYKQFVRVAELRFDLLVDSCVLVETKCVEKIMPIHKAQLLSYMRLLDVPLGLVINFHDSRLVDGISRLILHGANQ